MLDYSKNAQKAQESLYSQARKKKNYSVHTKKINNNRFVICYLTVLSLHCALFIFMNKDF